MPRMLSERVESHWEAFQQAASAEAVRIPANPQFLESLQRVWACSEFVATACVRNPGLLEDLLVSGELLADSTPAGFMARVGAAVKECRDEESLARVLRILRQREMVRIAWRDLAGWAPLEEILEDLSSLADACLECALGKLQIYLAGDLTGRLRKHPPPFVVIGMGKLGASELNFSSDIDLVFSYPDAGKEWGRNTLSPDEYYRTRGRRLITALDAKTDRGFVYRVDMRLRPYGDSGPLVASFDAMADYYQLQGREWERYAMIKARPVAGNRDAGEQLMESLRPFVYRRYLDFGAFESLRSLKAQIEHEVERKGLADNIKLGPGGIREVEFIAQAFQLVRGGRQPGLQQRSLLKTLQTLSALEFLPARAAAELADGYRFLRRVENRLQSWADHQTHELPTGEEAQAVLAFSMGYADWEAFQSELARHRNRIQGHFEQIFAAPAEATGSGDSGLRDMAAVWLERLPPDESLALLAEHGFDSADDALEWIMQFRKGTVLRFMGEQGRARLDQLMPVLLQKLADSPKPVEALKRIGRLLEAIAGRTAYLSLLAERPTALTQVVRLCTASPWIASELSRHPLLLDETLDQRTLYEPLGHDRLEQLLERRLDGIPVTDLEQQMDRLRQFKQAAVLRVAAADVAGVLPLMKVSDYLTWIAEVLLVRVLDVAWQEMVERYGRPRYKQRGKLRDAGFSVVAYGKLGGIELGYGSDLDLVFLHDSTGEQQNTTGSSSVDNSVFFTRLTQRIIHILNTMTQAGVLYEVDTRLRPSGASGLLVSGLDAFADYQRKDAWTWEHQALVRARVVAGAEDIARQFDRIRAGILARPREQETLRNEVREMRERMREELVRTGPDCFDLKQDRGGIADIEFMVQYSVLSWSCDYPELLKYTDNVRLLETFSATGLMAEADASALADAYRAYRSRAHQLTLQAEPSIVPAGEMDEHRSHVIATWNRMMEK